MVFFFFFSGVCLSNDIIASWNGVDVSDGIKVRLKLSAADILRLADNITSTSKSVHDAVAAVPLDQVCEHFLQS